MTFHSPGRMDVSEKPPMEALTSLRVGCPIAAVILRTWRFLPSVSVMLSHVSEIACLTLIGGSLGGMFGLGSSIEAMQGKHLCPRIMIVPEQRRSSAIGSGMPSTWTWYVLGWALDGSSSLPFSPDSLDRSSKPSESMSSLPRGYTPFGKVNSASVRCPGLSGVNWHRTP